MSPMPSFKPEISTGNIISICTVVVGLAIGWQALSSTVDNVVTKALKLELEVEKLRDKVNANELTTQKALTEIQGDMRYMRQSLDHLVRSITPRSAP